MSSTGRTSCEPWHRTAVAVLNLHSIAELNDASLQPYIYHLNKGTKAILLVMQDIILSDTAITSDSVITLLKHCPKLRFLDAGECRG